MIENTQGSKHPNTQPGTAGTKILEYWSNGVMGFVVPFCSYFSFTLLPDEGLVRTPL